MSIRSCLIAAVACGLLVVADCRGEEPTDAARDSIAPLVQQLLSLDRRDEAMRQIIENQRYHSEGRLGVGNYKETKAAPVKHVVVCPQPAGPPLFAVFLQSNYSSEQHRPLGHIILVDSQGAMVRVYHAANSLGKDSILADVNHDGVVEVVKSHGLNGAELLYVLPITPEQAPILRIVIERPRRSARIGNHSTHWTWKAEQNTDEFVIRLGLEDRKTGDFTEKAAFRWSAEEKQFIGPDGGVGEGFMRITGPAGTREGIIAELQQIQRFVRGSQK